MSLKHPIHADKIMPIRRDAKEVLGRMFRAQKRALLKQIDAHLHILGYINPNLREADDAPEKSVFDALPDGYLLPLTVSGAMNADYSSAVTAAIQAGYTGLADDLGIPDEIEDDVVAEYLRDHSLTKLSGNIGPETVKRLRTALADTYQTGGDYDDLKQAVKDTYDSFADVRAGMIAQTEMNGAYNAGRKQLGLDMGFNEKSWNPDGMACVAVCVPNVLDGWIGMEEDFESGDSAPPAHPNCDCSLDVRFSQNAS